VTKILTFDAANQVTLRSFILVLPPKLCLNVHI